MKQRLLKMWESRSPRDRVIMVILAALIGAVLYFWLVQSAYRARTQLGTSLNSLRAQAARLNLDATELDRVRALPAPPTSKTDLRTLVQARIEVAGLARALVRIDAPDASQVQVVFGSVSFADWLALVANLQAEHIRLDTGRIEALSTTGMVGVTATLTRAKKQ